MKKLSAMILALILVLTMTAAAFAADDTYKGSGNTNATGVAGKTEIPLAKSIIFFNENSSTVYEPNITFRYAVAPDTALDADGTTAKVTDGQTPAVTRNVYPGPDGGVTGTTITFSTDKTASTLPSGVEVEETGDLSVDLSKFSRPGIYRYLITETPDPEDVKAAGLTERGEGYKKTRYLDVYIRYNASGALEMYGAVIFKSASDTPGQDSIDTDFEKTTGFEPAKDASSDYSKDQTVDKYTTYDFTVKKTVSGSMADKNHEFPFYVTVSNSISGAKFTYTADSSETFTDATNTSGVVELTAANFSIGSDAKTSNLTLKHNDTIKLVGLPSNQTTELAVVIKEFNDTYDQYTPSASATNGTLSMTTGTAMTAQTGSDVTGSFTVKTNDVAVQILAIDNNLTEISPTGLTLRVAPYALLLIAGIALLVISRRHRASKEEE